MPSISGFQCPERCVGGRDDSEKASNVNWSEIVISADLGSSSNYSNEIHIADFFAIVKL